MVLCDGIIIENVVYRHMIYYVALHHNMLHYNAFYYVMLFCIMVYHILLPYTLLYYTAPLHAPCVRKVTLWYIDGADDERIVLLGRRRNTNTHYDTMIANNCVLADELPHWWG